MRLLLDEHYSPKVARALRERCYDVAAVVERDDLRGATNWELLRTASSERRALVTENVGSFMPLVREAAVAGQRFSGLVFTSARSLPRGRSSAGRLVATLETLLDGRQAEHALRNQVHWLGAA